MAKKSTVSKVKRHPANPTRTVTIMTPNGPMRFRIVFDVGTKKLSYKVLERGKSSARPNLLSWTLSGLQSKDPNATQEARAMWRRRFESNGTSKPT